MRRRHTQDEGTQADLGEPRQAGDTTSGASDSDSRATGKTRERHDRHTRKRSRRRQGCCRHPWCWAVFVPLLIAVLLYRVIDSYQGARIVMPAPILQRLTSLNITLPLNMSIDSDGGISLPVWTDIDSKRPGKELLADGYRPKHPVVIVPGFVTSGLDLWQGSECGQKYFRRRLWGSFTMTQTFVTDTQCWMEHMRLNASNGLDPEGVKLRAAEGLEAVDYFMPGYHVWAKLIEALADLGYDTNTLISMSYDWRLAVPNMEERDGYFTRMKNTIEVTHALQKEKVMVVSHSWGDNVFRNFMHWVDRVDASWVDTHLAVYVNIAGPVLGVPKAVTALLSGEMRDTAELGQLGIWFDDYIVTRQQRAELFRTWGSLIGMLPIGGNAIWGTPEGAPDDNAAMRASNKTFGSFFTVQTVNGSEADHHHHHHSHHQGSHNRSVVEKLKGWVGASPAKGVRPGHNETHAAEQMDIDDAVKTMLRVGGDTFEAHVKCWGAVHADRSSCGKGKSDPSKEYFNPLITPLPKARNLQLLCLYGVGSPAERAYHYLKIKNDSMLDDPKGDAVKEDKAVSGPLWKINTEVAEDAEAGGLATQYGVLSGEGDGTVPLLSMGLMCQKGWRQRKLNPSGMRVVAREYLHEPVAIYKDLRGGPRSSAHVDILGHEDVIHDVLLAAAGHADKVEDRFHSEIREIADRIDLDSVDA